MKQTEDKNLEGGAKAIAKVDAAKERLRTVIPFWRIWHPSTIYQWQYDPKQRDLYTGGDPDSDYWKERWLAIPRDPERRKQVEEADAAGKPKPDYWDLFGGRIQSSRGEFPVVFARHELREMGYTVLGSEPRLIDPKTRKPEGYSLLSHSGPPKKRNGCYTQMERFFKPDTLTSLIAHANEAKVELKKKAGGDPKKEVLGGDPDLFVFRPENPTDGFFVEVKDVATGDEPFDKQWICFALIEDHLQCEVKLCCASPAKRPAL